LWWALSRFSGGDLAGEALISVRAAKEDRVAIALRVEASERSVVSEMRMRR
jgi:hypothetical protein